jgi:hypothetical protein
VQPANQIYFILDLRKIKKIGLMDTVEDIEAIKMEANNESVAENEEVTLIEL